MTKKKNILLTFDYELFLGRRSGSAENCLLLPTKILEKTLNKYKAVGVFFVDTLCLNRIKEDGDLEQYKRIIHQVRSLHNNGHYIFPHIHPHWLDAKKEGTHYNLSDQSRYSMVNVEQKLIGELFDLSLKLLINEGIVYEEWGYRAGGWCIQPFSVFNESFRKHNIKSEFSVVAGAKNTSVDQSFDFSGIKLSSPYLFNDSVELENTEGEFIEFPISTINFSKTNQLFDRMIKKVLWKTGDRGYGDGLSAASANLISNQRRTEMISIDSFSKARLKPYLKYLKVNDYMHWISHPKMFTKHGLNTFESFLKLADKHYQIEYNYKKMYK